MKKKVLIDVRRKLNSGIGRVTQWIVSNLTDTDFIEFYYFTFKENISTYHLNESRCILTEAKLLSTEEVHETPDLILKYHFDLYINPQFNISPFITTKTITMLHDFWYLKSEKALPTINDLSNKLDLKEGDYFNVINNWLTDKNAELLMTDWGLKKYKQEKELKNNVLDLIWSQLSVFSFFSHSIVFISEDVKNDYERVFKKKANSAKSVGEDYYVKKGDSLSQISKKFNITNAELLKSNAAVLVKGLRTGQKLKLLVDNNQSAS